jgi:hypothetical protein
MNAKNRGKPSPDDLAGIPVTHEETPPLLRRGRIRPRREREALLPAVTRRKPTADDLAGIPVCVVAKEDCTVRPRRRR